MGNFIEKVFKKNSLKPIAASHTTTSWCTKTWVPGTLTQRGKPALPGAHPPEGNSGCCCCFFFGPPHISATPSWTSRRSSAGLVCSAGLRMKPTRAPRPLAVQRRTWLPTHRRALTGTWTPWRRRSLGNMDVS